MAEKSIEPLQNAPQKKQRRWYLRTRFWLSLLVLELVGGWFILNAQVVRGPTPETAAAAGIAFLSPDTHLGEVRWERISNTAGSNGGRQIRLAAYRNKVRVATATVDSFLWLGWQMCDYATE
jgi:hypothetical protein